MRNFLQTTVFATALFGIGIATAPLHAATFTTNFNPSSSGPNACAGAETVGATTTCVTSATLNGNTADLTLRTRTENGNFGLSADLTVIGSPGPASVGALFTARVGVTFSDTLTFSNVNSGMFVVPIDLAGYTFAPAPSRATDYVGVLGYSATDFQFDAVYRTAQGGFDGGTVYSEERVGTTFINDPADNALTELIGSTGIQNILFPIIDGQTELSVSMGAGVTCSGLFTPANPCQARVDFLNSARFLAASVQDANGNDVSGFAVSSTSGFDYITGVEPHAISPVPLPASGVMFLAGLLGLLTVARRKSDRLHT